MSMAATAHEDVSFERENCDFVSHGVDCAGWLYRPAESENPPVIIMAHGLAACRSYGLPTFAERFAAEGYAVFVFDYRGFGDSAGEWRNNVDVNRHGEDWDAAIAHVKTLPGIDAERIILWGTSYSGAHVIHAASRDASIAALVAQVPYAGFPEGRGGLTLSDIASMTWHLVLDGLSRLFNNKPHYVPVLGKEGSIAPLNTPECIPGYLSMVPGDEEFANRLPVWALVQARSYRPGDVAGKVECPCLIVVGENDSLIPVEQARRMAENLQDHEFKTLACNHFEPYSGKWFEENISAQIEFLKRVVSPKNDA